MPENNRPLKKWIFILLKMLVLVPFVAFNILFFYNTGSSRTSIGDGSMITADKSFDSGDHNNSYDCSDIEPHNRLSKEKLLASLQNARGWMFSNFNTGGYFTYEYDPSSNKYSKKNNVIRQLMASRILAKETNYQEDPVNWNNLNRMHKMNLNVIFSNWYMEDEGLGYIYFGNKSKLGAMAMAIRILVCSPHFKKYEENAVRLANTILHLQNENGSFRAWYIEPDYIFDEERLLRFYSGEAILSLVELYEATGNEFYLERALISQDYYLREYIDKMEEDESYYPAFIPWHTICLNKLFFITEDARYKDAVYKITDRIITMQDQEGGVSPDYLGRFYNPETPEYGSPHSASTAVYLEGVAYAYEIAVVEKDLEKKEEYRKSILLGVHNLMNLQYDDLSAEDIENPERIKGAIRISAENNTVRIDSTQHTIDAFDKILEVFELD